MNELENCFRDENLIYAVLTGPKGRKLTFRPLVIKGEAHIQIAFHENDKVKHKNLPFDDAKTLFLEETAKAKNGVVYTQEGDYHLLINRRGEITIRASKASKEPSALRHNAVKPSLIPTDAPFLKALGIKADKLRQIHRYLEIVQSCLDVFKNKKTLHVVDFGCGKAYLTFALYHLLHMTHGMDVTLYGIDLKQEVIDNCNHLARSCGFKKLSFAVGDINNYRQSQPIDIMISLHACDTATDAALEKAVAWNAKVILAVPCCQHEQLKYIQCDSLKPLLKHGILKERFSALVTDAARAQWLEVQGYQTDVIEFIDMEHTPKNILIRAIKRDGAIDTKAKEKELREFVKFLAATRY